MSTRHPWQAPVVVVAGLALVAIVLAPATARAEGEVMYIVNDRVGVGTATPDSGFHLTLATVGDGGTHTGVNSAFHIKQETPWTAAQPWALFVEGYTNLGGLRFNGKDGPRTIHMIKPGLQMGFSTQGNDAITFTQLATQERMRIAPGGYVGIGRTDPSHLIHIGASGAYCDGGAWVDGSSREVKQDIRDLTAEEASRTLEALAPVRFAYKATPEDEHNGFIAEDVPDLVAVSDRKGVAAMDVVAVLTKVVQEQQKTIAELKAKVEALERR